MASALRKPAAAAIDGEGDAYSPVKQRKELLRFITCGSVDDGKSTLIGRLLYDSKLLLDDQLATLESDSRKSGAHDDMLDFASLVDGLSAEREQGITIDVAYRFFATERRKFVVADTPGHEQYTRNMVTGASTADLAVILIDASEGVLRQTRRHSHIAHLLGIRHLVVAVNKMDLVNFSRDRFDAVVADFAAFARGAGIEHFTAIPISGLHGDNIARRSERMCWYGGPTLLGFLEAVPVNGAVADNDEFRMPVQWVNRPGATFRGYAGTIASGQVHVGDRIRVLPSGAASAVARIVTFDGDLAFAGAGQAVTLTLARELDCSRGDLIVGEKAEVSVSDRLDVTLVWMASEMMVPGRAYRLKIGTQTVSASIRRVTSVVDINSGAQGDGRPLALNDIGRCEIVLDRPIPALTYARSRKLGGFILIDRASHATLAAGMIRSFPDHSDEQTLETGGGRIVWLTGSSEEERAGFARKARERLRARGRPSFILDAGAIRDGLNSDLGESPEDQKEQRRRMFEVATLLSRAGVTVLAALDPPNGGGPGTEIDVTGAGTDWDWVI